MQEGENEGVQQSKISDARGRKRDSRMACSSYVAHGLDDGSQGKGLPASVHADENADRSAHRPPGKTLDEALEKAYAGVEKIHFDGAHYRHDIGRTK